VPDFDVNPVTTPVFPGRSDAFDADAEGGIDEFLEEAPAPPREGLPPTFRMRHAPHYVEQLMGEAPIQTVRQIPVQQIAAPAVDEAVVAGLADSVRELGILQPLLIVRVRDGEYELVAGCHRLAAAKLAGLAKVPCLLIDADDARLPRLREDVRRRASLPPISTAVAEDAAPAHANPPHVLVSAFGEISASLSFLNRLMPHAGAPGFRGSVSADILKVETERASALAAAVGLLMRMAPASLDDVDCAAEFQSCRPNIDLGGRLKGVQVEWAEAIQITRTVADKEALATGWAGLLHAVLGMARAGDRLRVSLQVPRVRPAVILNLAVSGSPLCCGDPGRLLDASWAEHPGGVTAAVMLAAAGQCARLHGGRLTIHPTDEGYTASLVLPQPLSVL
jgi:uncharacterized ParB-like nuclease family protein